MMHKNYYTACRHPPSLEKNLGLPHPEIQIKQESWLDQKVKDKASELLEFCLPHHIFTLPQLSPL